jgi:integrase
MKGNRKKEDKYRFFYPPEFEKMLDFLNKNGKFTARFMINTGCRIMEARGFKQEPVFDNERFNITLLHTKVRARLKEKTPRSRTIPISKPFFYELKRELLEHRILSTNAFNIALREACNQANIPKPEQFSSHNIRKTFATWMLSLGCDGFKLAKHLGHTPNELARDYATNDVFNHADKEIMRSILKDLPERIR